ncbi:hypothetical protein CF160_01435 [Enterococcus pseudoavium]|nr:hypothetical protein CF160_01435 [Enterococcus pseudoavium]
MKKWMLVIVLSMAVGGLTACGNDKDQETGSSTAVSTTAKSSAASESNQSKFQQEVTKIVDGSNGEVLGITVTGQEGFDSIKVKMKKELKDLTSDEQLATCQKYQPEIIAAYQTYYVEENSGEHKPVTNYFADGTPIAMTERQQADPEKLVIVE